MKTQNELQTFLLPGKVTEQSSVIHSSCYRLSLSMLRRAEQQPVAVPIDSLGCIALITETEIFFAKPRQQDEAVKNADARIKISWHLHLAEARDVNDQHIPMRIIFYDHGLEQLQQQLTGEFYKALMLMDESYRDNLIPSGDIEIMPV